MGSSGPAFSLIEPEAIQQSTLVGGKSRDNDSWGLSPSSNQKLPREHIGPGRTPSSPHCHRCPSGWRHFLIQQSPSKHQPREPFCTNHTAADPEDLVKRSLRPPVVVRVTRPNTPAGGVCYILSSFSCVRRRQTRGCSRALDCQISRLSTLSLRG